MTTHALSYPDANRQRPVTIAALALLVGLGLAHPARSQALPNWVTSQSPATGVTPLSIAVGDFNGDGTPDIAVGGVGSVSFLLGNGDGTFHASAPVATMSGNLAIAAAALQTGKTAGLIVVSNTASNANNAELFLVNGSGVETVQTPFSLPFGSGSFVATGDFNGDGSQDFAVTFKQDNKVSVYLGN